MRRLAALLAGGIPGFAGGTILTAHLAASAFGPTPVDWDASACRPGTYTITATATSLTGGEAYVTIASNVRLPQPTVTLEFPNLPPGAYLVTASVRGRHGAPAEAESQTVSGLGAWAAAGTRGHRSPLLPQPGSTAAPPAAPMARPESASVTTSARILPASPVQPAEAAPAAGDGAGGIDPPASLASRLLRQFGRADLAGADPACWRLEAIDTDGDDLPDVLLFEWMGDDTWIRVMADLRDT